MKRSRPVAIVLVGLFLWQTACMSYQQIDIEDTPEHGRVRVTLDDGTRADLHDPVMDADSLRGRDLNGRSPHERVIPLDRIVEVEAVGTNEVATVLTVLGVSAAALATVVLIACSDGGCFDLGWSGSSGSGDTWHY